MVSLEIIRLISDTLHPFISCGGLISLICPKLDHPLQPPLFIENLPQSASDRRIAPPSPFQRRRTIESELRGTTLTGQGAGWVQNKKVASRDSKQKYSVITLIRSRIQDRNITYGKHHK